MEFFFSPDLFIIGGGISKKSDKFMPLLKTRARIVPAQLMNDAGIIGAAMYVRDMAVTLDNPPQPSANAPSDEVDASASEKKPGKEKKSK